MCQDLAVVASEVTEVDVGGRRLRLSNLTKVLYPEVGFTKAEVINYYVRVAPLLLTHAAGRCITFRRFPDGVDRASFFNKRCPDFRPPWLTTKPGPGEGGQGIDYCQLNEVAAIAWAANLAALELHGPMARSSDLDSPTMVVFDLDPGAPATIVECAQVALDIRELIEPLGLVGFPKTSGSKGMQVYVPLNSPGTHEGAKSFALAVAQLLAKRYPKRILASMSKDRRSGKVFIDWSQNSRHKTTICAYSLRARSRPTVSTPITWPEVVSGAEGEHLSFEVEDVLERVDRLGDLFAETATLVQELPRLAG